MATEGCPDRPPKWSADVVPPEPTEIEPGRISPVGNSRRHARARAREARREARLRKRGQEADAPKTKVTAKAARREAPELIAYPETTDQLVMYDRHKREIGHALQNFWWPTPAAFLVCGGPSIKELDLELLKQKGVMSLAVNNVAAVTPVRAMCFSDPPEKFHNGIFLDGSIMKFVPHTKLSKRMRIRDPNTKKLVFSTVNVNHCPSVFAYRKNACWNSDTFLTADCATLGSGKDCPKWQAAGRKPEEKIIFTFFIGLRLLHYLGIRTVYLLGVDFNMEVDNYYAFNESRTPGMAMGNNRYYRQASEMLAELKPLFAASDFRVFNTNPKSHLTVFDYVPYQSAITHCRQLIPQTEWELNMNGWYTKAGEEMDDRGEDD
jgi:hypothetical protein